jgi:hypothetical protein
MPIRGDLKDYTLDELIDIKAYDNAELQRIERENKKEKHSVKVTRMTSLAKLAGILSICPVVCSGIGCLINYSPFKRDDRKVDSKSIIELTEKGTRTDSTTYDGESNSYVTYYSPWLPTENGNYSRTAYKYQINPNTLKMENLLLLYNESEISKDRFYEVIKESSWGLKSEKEEVKPSVNKEDLSKQGTISAEIIIINSDDAIIVPESKLSNGITIGVIIALSVIVDIIIMSCSTGECGLIDDLLFDIFSKTPYLEDDKKLINEIALLENIIGERKLAAYERLMIEQKNDVQMIKQDDKPKTMRLEL